MNTSSNAVRGAETATEQLQLELERLRSELDRCTTRLQLTEKLLEHVADAVFVADLDGRMIDVNPAACSSWTPFLPRPKTNRTLGVS
jgi:PAS domain-containing protein